MRSSRPGWSSSDDYTAFSLLVIVVGLGFGVFALWHFQHQWIAWGFAVAADRQAALYGLVTRRFSGLHDLLGDADYASVTPGEMWRVATLLGSYIRWPAVAVIGALAVPCYIFAAPSRFTRRFDLSGLIKEQAQSFPSIRVTADRELRLVRPENHIRPLDPALTVREWVSLHATGGDGFSEPRARAELAAQLGPLWSGSEHGAPIVRILFTAFALHLAGQRKEALGLLAELASGVGAVGGGSDRGPEAPIAAPAEVLASADQASAKLDLRAALAVVGGHAYTHTALMGLLNEARRKSGVLPPSSFLAVKLVDRRLWYALHGLGFPGDGPGQNVHPNPRIEAAGSRAHWQAECLAGRPLFVAQIDAALVAARMTLDDAHGRPSKEGR